MRKWVVVLIAAVAVVAVVAVVVTQQSQQQAEAARVDQWHQDLQVWEEAQAEALAAPEGPLLSEVVTGAAMTALPPEHADQVADVDEVNAACTSLTAYASKVSEAPGPPAAPADADFTDTERERFDRDLQALQTFRETVAPAASTIRQFCGSYPLLVMAHTEGGPDAVSSFGQALAVQCPLAELDQACAALQAAASGQASEAEVDAATVTTVITEELQGAEQTLREAATNFQQALPSAASAG